MTKSQRQWIAEQYRAGTPLKIIAHKFDKTPQHVGHIALAEGCEPRKGSVIRLISAAGAQLSPVLVSQRMQRGWDAERAATVPPRRYGRSAHA